MKFRLRNELERSLFEKFVNKYSVEELIADGYRVETVTWVKRIYDEEYPEQKIKILPGEILVPIGGQPRGKKN